MKLSMAHTFDPDLDIRPTPQRHLWGELGQVPLEFVLCGGAAVALHLGDAQSHLTSGDGIKVGSLLELAGMKAAVVQQRAEAKDYLDIDAILADGRIDLSMALASAKGIYGRQFNPLLTLKALSFFEDGDLPQLSLAVRERLASAARRVDLDRLPALPQKDPPR